MWSRGADIDAIFKRMSEGSAITMPLEDAFWGASFGMLKDKFGVNWMLTRRKKKNW